MAIESLGQFCCLCGCLVLLAVYLLRGVWLGLERNYLQKRFRTNVGLVAGFACLRSATLALRLQVAISHDSGQSSSLTAHHGTNLLIVDLPDFFVLVIQSPTGAQSTLYCVYGPYGHVGGAPPRSREPWARGPKPPQQW